MTKSVFPLLALIPMLASCFSNQPPVTAMATITTLTTAPAQTVSFATGDEITVIPMPVQETYSIKRRSNTFESLLQAGLEPATIHEIVNTAKPIYDLSQMHAGTKYIVDTNVMGEIKGIQFRVDNTSYLRVSKESGLWHAKLKDIPTTTKLISYSGSITDSLWSSGINAEVPPYLIVSMAEVFSWEIDFYREIRKGDSWRFTAEEIFAEGKHVGWGNIVYAEYINQEKVHKAYYFESKDKEIYGHYDETGQSLRRMFLKSPMKFGRISSGFSLRRFHPIKKVYRPHLGVDYAAPTGTPIRSIGEGTIIKIGRYGSAGKMISIRHPASYKTRYMHLSRYGRGLKKGSRVKQGQIIGYVGQTGGATGPHLHFELYERGRFKDPLKIKLPPSGSIPVTYMDDFKRSVLATNQKINSDKITSLPESESGINETTNKESAPL